MKANHNSLVIGLLATTALTVGMAEEASAEVISFLDNGSLVTPSLTEGNVTVSGSGLLQVFEGAGIDI